MVRSKMFGAAISTIFRSEEISVRYVTDTLGNAYLNGNYHSSLRSGRTGLATYVEQHSLPATQLGQDPETTVFREVATHSGIALRTHTLLDLYRMNFQVIDAITIHKATTGRKALQGIYITLYFVARIPRE
jgi:hypothetical protein